jgi:integrase/recombinase XerC
MIAATDRAVVAGRPDALRDRAVVRLLADCALRRAEVLGLDVAHFDAAAGTVAVLGKGRAGREALTLPAPTRAALAAYLATHPTPADPAAPLFPGDGATGRLTGRTVARLVARAAAAGAVGRAVRPHGLRHAAITEALERTGGDVRRVAKFSRHKDLRTLTVYDDNRRDLGGEVAALVAGAW